MSGWLRRVPAIVCIAALPLSCAPKADTDQPIETPVMPVGPDYAQLAQTHNRRVGRLQKLYSRGVVEIRWEDEAGRHFEQGNVQLWLSLPRQTALRVEKLGDVLLWLGSNDQGYWLFDMIPDETVLYWGRHDEESGPQSDSAIALKPLALLDLMGLSPLPPAEQDDSEPPPPVHFDEEHDGWEIAARGAGGLMRICFDRESLLPKRVESLDAEGRIVAASGLRRYARVEMEGSLSVNWPQLPTLADIDLTEGENSLRLALESPTTIMDDQPLDRIFDFERLQQALRPDRVEEAITPDDS
ncbi:MAG: hypothetical protein JSV91_05385 [Phycisphaerales bacterium]|nr:MAG: hypothetical protein JSV91_05385 [Phycisphaerales bacterium]